MPFRAENFKEHVKLLVQGPAKDKLMRIIEEYRNPATPGQKAIAIHNIMDLLDREVESETRRKIMEACGRRCIGDSILMKALKLKSQSADLDDLLIRLNEARIGGSLLRREGNVIFAEYHKCHCGSVSRTKTEFSPTYCYCSCGWFRRLFETILEKPVTVVLLGSIIQGYSHCRFKIYLRKSTRLHQRTK